jgi:hypothetical protein
MVHIVKNIGDADSYKCDGCKEKMSDVDGRNITIIDRQPRNSAAAIL